MRALVTGGCGFIGSHIVDQLIQRGDLVRVIDDLSNGSMENLHREAEFIKASIADNELLTVAFGDVDVVFHNAVLRIDVEKPQKTHAVNVTGTLNVLEASRQNQVKKVIYSSCEGQKINGRSYCDMYANNYAMTVVSLIYGDVHGPRSNKEKKRDSIWVGDIIELNIRFAQAELPLGTNTVVDIGTNKGRELAKSLIGWEPSGL